MFQIRVHTGEWRRHGDVSCRTYRYCKQRSQDSNPVMGAGWLGRRVVGTLDKASFTALSPNACEMELEV